MEGYKLQETKLKGSFLPFVFKLKQTKLHNYDLVHEFAQTWFSAGWKI